MLQAGAGGVRAVSTTKRCVRALYPLLIGGALSACGPATKLPPLPTPGPDYCSFYQSFRYSPAAAAVEAIDALRKHNANEIGFAEKCLLGPRPDSLGPR